MARKSRKNTGAVIEAPVQISNYFSTAIYVRLSIENSGKDDDGDSIANQISFCKAYLAEHTDLKLYDIYEDNGEKGTNFDRPAFKRMMDDIRGGKVKCVLVKDLSRFGRDYIEAGEYLEKIFPFMGIRFISITDGYDSLTCDDAESALMIPLKNMINDECHHAASNTSMELLQKINAKYVYGVSATPKRGDSLDRIIYMLLGPLRHRFTALERAQEQGIGHYFVPRYTRVVDNAESKDDINKAYSLISTSRVRNEMIVNDVLTCVARKQTPVILTKFKEHAKFLYDALKGEADHVFLLYGDNSDKENAEIRVRLKQVPENETLILVATGQKIGEGFDFPRLDVLMLAAPVSFEGRLEQYVGRLNRDFPGKEAVYVYDYIDSHVRFFDKMYAKRLRTYKKTGFSIWTGELQSKQMINAIFDSGNYTEKFEQDIVEAEKMVVISSPDIRQDKIERFLFLIKGRQEAGVKVTIITTDPEEIVYGSSDVCHELIRTMQLVGMNVVTKTEVEERFAVIDDELVWHGGMNLLGKVDVWDNLMRIRNHQVAAELLEIALGYLSEK